MSVGTGQVLAVLREAGIDYEQNYHIGTHRPLIQMSGRVFIPR
ncbi:hypothetical protein [Candidatus Reidiella endopervernicosa]|nr:hypothetical protein [Candidatus Reidiella endopervernicosa]